MRPKRSSRAEVERRLLEDEKLRAQLAEMREIWDAILEAEAEGFQLREDFYSMVRKIVERSGLPPSVVARQLGLSPQWIASILHPRKGAKPGRGRKR
jgi:hypothetical protein